MEHHNTDEDFFCRIVFVPEECLVPSEESSDGSTTDHESLSESLKLSDIHEGPEEFS